MNGDFRHNAEVIAYESEVEHSFDSVVNEADLLYEGQGRLRKTFQRLVRRMDDLAVSYSLIGGYALILHIDLWGQNDYNRFNK
jgi:hypothetical protein